MNTANVTANNIVNVAATATQPPPTANITTIKTHQQPTAILHQPSTISIPATIITATSNETRLNKSSTANQTPPPTQQPTSVTSTSNHSIQNHEPQSLVQHSSPATATFTIHASTGVTQTLQTIPNNLVVTSAANVVGTAGQQQQAQIQTVNAVANTTSIIHPVTITGITTTGSSSVVCTATILPTGATVSTAGGHPQVTAIPVGPNTVLKAQPTMTTLPIGQRFQATNVAIGTSNVPSSQPTGTPINALFIHQDPIASQKNLSNSVAHATMATTSNHPHQQSHASIQQNSTTTATVINTSNVSVAGVPGTTTVTLQPISSHSNSQQHHAPIFVQTGPNTNSNTATPNSAIFHQIGHHHPNSSSQPTPSSQLQQQQPTNLSTINLSTSSVQQQPSAPTPSQSAPQQQFQRLKVEDALSYLDQVKFKFNDRPQVYNDFLDIMKEFKSQSIDTPGVIQRVSNLFKGHPELIVGFNTFLPPGYKIEIHSNDQVNVSMPNSTNVVLMPNTPLTPSTHQKQSISAVTAPAGHAIVASSQNIHQIPSNLVRSPSLTSSNQSLHHGGPPSHHSHHTFGNSISPRNETTNLSLASTSLPHSTTQNCPSFNQNRIETTSNHNHRSSSGHIDSNSRAQATTIHHHLVNASQQNAANVPGSGPVEFNHAINYVNKIKNRFLDQPEIYKQFLDILQSYQKEQDNSGQKILTESEVFSKVSKLFENQPDLLQEFSQFLPDAHNSSGVIAGGVVPHTLHPNQATNATSHHHHHMNNSNNLINSSPSYSIQNSANPTTSSLNQYGHHHQANLELSSSNYTHQPPSQTVPISHEQHNSMSIKKTISVINTNSVIPNRTSIANSNTPNAFPNAFHRTPKRSISNNQIEQSNSPHVSLKRSKLVPFRETATPEAGKYMGDLVEYAFFDKLRLAMNSPYNYETFLRCLILFNNEIVNRSELAQLVHPLFLQCPDLYKRFKEMLNIKEGSLSMNSANLTNHNLYYNLYNNPYMNSLSNSSYHTNSYANSSIGHLEGLSNRIASFRDRRDNEFAEVDFASCKRYGVSYRTIPKSSAKQECSGRTPLCREVLNDTLASFPSWSEDSTFVSSRKTQYEEYVYRCEDERYELDLIIETNLSTIRVLESVQRKMEAMTSEEKSNFKLDDTLGGSSHVIHINSIRRIYGENSVNVIEGIKNSPANVIPLVLRRLISKDEEWRDAQKQFNRNWREQNEKYYLKSLDHQGISFKQNDIKFLRSKSLLTEIENIAEERSEQNEQQSSQWPSQHSNGNDNLNDTCQSEDRKSETLQMPHMIFAYPDKSMIDVACNLIIHHVKRQTSIHKEDKRKIKQLMRHFIPDLFATPRGELSDDEIEDEPKNEKAKTLEHIKLEKYNDPNKNEKTEIKPQPMLNSNPDEEYSLFFVNNFWYLFFRLHNILCERLSKMHKRAQQIAADEVKENQNRNLSPSSLLRLRNNHVKVENYFSTLVDMIKQVLDGNLDSTQYEDNLREMFSIHAYIAFTLDKVVQNIVRQLQHIVVDECSQQCTELYLEACKSGSAGGLCNTAQQRAEAEYSYQKNIEQIIPDDNRYKIVIYKGEGKITIDLLESNDDDDEDSTNDGDDDSNIPQSSRTLRSTTKNMSAKEREKCLMNEQKVNELVAEKFLANPPFLKKYVRKHKGSFDPIAQMNSDSNEAGQQSPRPNEETNSTSNSSEKETNNLPNSTNDEKITNKESASDINQPAITKGDSENRSSSANAATNNDKNKTKDTTDANNECEFDIHRFKSLIFVQNETVLYRKNIDKPRMSHKKISQSKFKRFNKWYSDWVDANCTESNKCRYEKWLLEQDTTGFRLNQSENNDDRPIIEKSVDIKSENELNNDDVNENSKNDEKLKTEISLKVSEQTTPSLSSIEQQQASTNTITTTNVDSNVDLVEKSADKDSITGTRSESKKIIQKVKFDSESVIPYRTYYKYLFKS
ncbi:Paired amphipathic helix protein Sin3a [Dermatophagoides pteronyssinus]|uniref:Paired amphipathic helix protein Sin3a n=1 Tax=Dermatophagoides pteronyssinus TaxID=6956 RepID=A0ABQ8JEG7_DERPT|nr:Paired amphipathic helix protein Sin3a [Dermatophagoides pteronyssinus]